MKQPMTGSDTGKPLALVTGVGPGTGAAIARRFAEVGYHVAMLAREADRLAALAHEIPGLAHQPREAWSFLAEVRPFSKTG